MIKFRHKWIVFVSYPLIILGKTTSKGSEILTKIDDLSKSKLLADLAEGPDIPQSFLQSEISSFTQPGTVSVPDLKDPPHPDPREDLNDYDFVDPEFYEDAATLSDTAAKHNIRSNVLKKRGFNLFNKIGLDNLLDQYQAQEFPEEEVKREDPANAELTSISAPVSSTGDIDFSSIDDIRSGAKDVGHRNLGLASGYPRVYLKNLDNSKLRNYLPIKRGIPGIPSNLNRNYMLSANPYLDVGNALLPDFIDQAVAEFKSTLKKRRKNSDMNSSSSKPRRLNRLDKQNLERYVFSNDGIWKRSLDLDDAVVKRQTNKNSKILNQRLQKLYKIYNKLPQSYIDNLENIKNPTKKQKMLLELKRLKESQNQPPTVSRLRQRHSEPMFQKNVDFGSNF